MKKILLLLLLMPALSLATEIKCYQNNKIILDRKVHDVVYGDGFFIVTDNKTNHILAVFADCVFILGKGN